MTRLLIADDHPIILSGISAMLAGTSYEIVASVSDGAAALDELAATRPDVLVLDVAMPRRGGLDVLRTLRGRGDTRPVVLLTATLDDGALIEAVQLGVNGILLKEGAQALLLNCLDTVSGGGRWIDRELLERALELTIPGSGGAGSRLVRLTPRELSIVRLVAQGRPNRAIGEELGITEGTVKVSLHRIYRRLGVSNRTELALKASELGVG